jgi:hypothetical protein
VLSFALEGGSRVMLRPSGTEPKIKYYFDLRVDVDPSVSMELSLAQARAAAGTNTVDVREAGGYLSVKGALDDAFALYAQGGFAAVLNPEDVAASYGYAGTVDAANPPAVGSGVLTSTGPGLRWNLATRAGIEWKAHPQLAFAAEGFFYRSRFMLQRVDEDRVRPIAHAVGGEIGAVYTF